MTKYTNDKITKLDIEINKYSKDLKMKNENLKKLKEEIRKIEKELNGKREEKREEVRVYEKFAQKAKEERKKEFLDVYGEDIEKRFISASARLDDLPVIITAGYHRIDLNEIKDVFEEKRGFTINFEDSIDEKTGKNYSISRHGRYAMILAQGTNSIDFFPKFLGEVVMFDLPKGGIVEFSSGTCVYGVGDKIVKCCSNRDEAMIKELTEKYHAGPMEIKHYAKARINRLKNKQNVSAKDNTMNEAKNEQVEENKFTKMTKGEMYRLDIDKLPEVSLAHQINVNLADYKKDLLALQSGEMLTFGRTDDEPIEIDRGEKLISFEDPSSYVSRKHLSIVNFAGDLYMKDRSLNGTGMREASKTDKTKSFVKPMEKDR